MNPFERALIIVFLFAQSYVTVWLLRAAARRFSNRTLTIARCVVAAFNLAVAAGYALTSSDFLAHLRIPAKVGVLAGALTLFYLGTITFALALSVVLKIARKLFREDADPGRRRVLTTASNFLMATPLAVLGYGALVQRTDFRVREVDVPMGGLPKGLDGVRILQLSDIHLGTFLSEGELARVIDMALELHPDLAVVTGDLISFHGDPLTACLRQLARLQAKAGVLGCLGNHERYAGVEKRVQEAGARCGIEFLRDRARQIRFGDAVLNIAGVDYQPTANHKIYLRGAERMVAPGCFNLLLSHNPDVFPVAAAQGYDLMLAGHTHGGQVTIEILDQSINPARFLTPFVYGLYRAGGAAAYVTRGIGTIGIPARIGAPPEISVLRLRKA